MPRDTLIRFRRGTNTLGPPSDIEVGEPYFDTATKELFIGNSGDSALYRPFVGTAIVSALSEDVVLANSNQWYRAVTLDLYEGTWLVIGRISFWRTATGARQYYARIYSNPKTYATGTFYVPSANPSGATIVVSARVVLSSGPITFELQGLSSSGSTSDKIAATMPALSIGDCTELQAFRLF